MAAQANVLDRPASKPAQYLRDHRLRITAWIGAGEGLLTLLHVIPHLAVYILAIAAVAFYITTARNYTSSTARQLTWIFAASQALAVLVPIVLHIAETVAVIAIAIIAAVALVFLFAERKKL
ncbi:MAG TPA: hypothetical protein VGM80_06595 [Gaiellaceae bacterium]|jgi:hypothetical protein